MKRRNYILLLTVLLILLRCGVYLEELDLIIQHIDAVVNEKKAVYEVEFCIVRDKIRSSYSLIMWYKNKNFVAVVKQPASEKGTVFLMRGNNAWVYYPTIQKRVKITPKQKILNSDFSFYEIAGLNLVEDYSHNEISIELIKKDQKVVEFLSKDTLLYATKVIESRAHKDRKVHFPKVTLFVDKDNNLMLILLYNYSMNLSGILEYQDYRKLSGKHKPTRIVLRSVVRREHYTEIIYKNANYEIEIPDFYFSTSYMEYLSNRD